MFDYVVKGRDRKQIANWLKDLRERMKDDDLEEDTKCDCCGMTLMRIVGMQLKRQRRRMTRIVERLGDLWWSPLRRNFRRRR